MKQLNSVSLHQWPMTTNSAAELKQSELLFVHRRSLVHHVDETQSDQGVLRHHRPQDRRPSLPAMKHPVQRPFSARAPRRTSQSLRKSSSAKAFAPKTSFETFLLELDKPMESEKRLSQFNPQTSQKPASQSYFSSFVRQNTSSLPILRDPLPQYSHISLETTAHTSQCQPILHRQNSPLTDSDSSSIINSEKSPVLFVSDSEKYASYTSPFSVPDHPNDFIVPISIPESVPIFISSGSTSSTNFDSLAPEDTPIFLASIPERTDIIVPILISKCSPSFASNSFHVSITGGTASDPTYESAVSAPHCSNDFPSLKMHSKSPSPVLSPKTSSSSLNSSSNPPPSLPTDNTQETDLKQK